jgi:hypothetical protein
MSHTVRANIVAQSHMLRALHTEGGATVLGIVEASGLHQSTVREWLNNMRRQRVVYIAGYEKDARDRDNAPRWAIGLDRRNARRSRMTDAERMRRHRANKAARVASVFHMGAAA